MALVIWVWMVIIVMIDIFSRPDLSGWGKPGWVALINRPPAAPGSPSGAPRTPWPRRRSVRRIASTGGAAAEIDTAKRRLGRGTTRAHPVGVERPTTFPINEGVNLSRERHLFTRVPVAMVAAVALVALAGCGSSKPAYCSPGTNLQNAVKNLPSSVSSSGISGLPSQLTTIKSDATTLVNDAKSDFPTQTSAVQSSVDTLQTAVKALPSSPSAAQLAALAVDAGNVVSSVNSFVDDSKSKCS